MKTKRHDLFSFMSQISQEIAAEYERIVKRVTEDPGTAGDQGEENWAELLRDWLPPTFQIVTKGRLIGTDGTTSPQVDVLVLKPSYPPKLLNKKLFLAAGVAAAFECKITLTSAHIKKATANAILIKSLFPQRQGSPYLELRSPIIYGVLAHSHSWKGRGSRPSFNIEKALWVCEFGMVTHPRLGLDLLCVADLATWASMAMTFIGPTTVPGWPAAIEKIYGPEGSAVTSFSGHSSDSRDQSPDFTPIGALVSHLIQKLAWEEPGCRDLADYYRLTHLAGSGEGKNRLWPPTIYSDATRDRVVRGLLNNVPWDQWSLFFF